MAGERSSNGGAGAPCATLGCWSTKALPVPAIPYDLLGDRGAANKPVYERHDLSLPHATTLGTASAQTPRPDGRSARVAACGG